MASWPEKFSDTPLLGSWIALFGGIILVALEMASLMWPPDPPLRALQQVEGVISQVDQPKVGLWILVVTSPAPRQDTRITWSTNGYKRPTDSGLRMGAVVQVWYRKVGRHNKLWQLVSNGRMIRSHDLTVASKRWGRTMGVLIGVVFIGLAFGLAQLHYMLCMWVFRRRVTR